MKDLLAMLTAIISILILITVSGCATAQKPGHTRHFADKQLVG